MNPTIDIDARQWQKAARDLFQTSSRSLVDFTNGQGLSVASRAIKLTEEANRAEIATALGQVGWKNEKMSVNKKTGKTSIRRSGRILHSDLDNTLAARILTKKFNETGKWLGKGKTLADKVRDFILRRTRSVSFIRSGWIPAIKKLGSVVKHKPQKATTGISGAKQFGQPKGKAIPAVSRLGLIQCTIENDIPGHVRGTDRIAEKGLQMALREAAADMIAKLAERLKKDLKPFGAK